MRKNMINFLAALSVFLAVPMISGCCKKYGPESKLCKIQELAIDCTKDAVKNLATEYLPAVLAILKGDIDTAKKWAQLDGLIAVGGDAVMCAVANAPMLFASQARAGGPPEHTARLKRSTQDALGYLGRYKVKARLASIKL